MIVQYHNIWGSHPPSREPPSRCLRTSSASSLKGNLACLVATIMAPCEHLAGELLFYRREVTECGVNRLICNDWGNCIGCGRRPSPLHWWWGSATHRRRGLSHQVWHQRSLLSGSLCCCCCRRRLRRSRRRSDALCMHLHTAFGRRLIIQRLSQETDLHDQLLHHLP